MPGLGRPQIDILVEGCAHLDEDALLQHPGRHPGVADGAEVHRLAAAHELDVVLGQELAGAKIPVGAEVHIVQLQRDVLRVGRGLEDLHALGDDLLADAVTRGYRDPIHLLASLMRFMSPPELMRSRIY